MTDPVAARLFPGRAAAEPASPATKEINVTKDDGTLDAYLAQMRDFLRKHNGEFLLGAGLEQIVRSLAVDMIGVGHAEGHRCTSCPD
jgi:hypothetical protein